MGGTGVTQKVYDKLTVKVSVTSKDFDINNRVVEQFKLKEKKRGERTTPI